MPPEILMRHSPAPPPTHRHFPHPPLTPNVTTTNSHGKFTPNYRAAAATKIPSHAGMHGLTISVIESSDFHDRFWIADRSRGLIVGTSLNKIGSKIFFVDELSQGDVRYVMIEVNELIAAQDQRA